MLQVKKCSNCKKSLPITNFETSKKAGKTYYRASCKTCRNTAKTKYQSSSPQAYLKTLTIQLRSKRFLKENIKFEIKEEDIIALWNKQQGRCALSNVLLTYHRDGEYGTGRKDFNASIDRINPAGGYTRDNVQLVATRVNLMKHTLGEDMLLWWVRAIYEHVYKSD